MRTEMRAVDVRRKTLDVSMLNAMTTDTQYCLYCGAECEDEFCSDSCREYYWYHRRLQESE